MFGPVTNIIIYEFTTNVVNNTFRKLDFIATCLKCRFYQEKIISILSLRPNVHTNLRTEAGFKEEQQQYRYEGSYSIGCA